jgi:hypothetical protein
MAKPFTREYRLELSTLMCAAGALITAVGAAGIFFSSPTGPLSPLVPLASFSGNWIYWYIVIGPILIIGGAWWLYDSLKKIVQLRRFLDVDSKAKFVKNLDEIEYLAWVLPRKYEELVIEKKKQFKV